MKQNEKLYNENPKGLFQILKETIKDKTLCRPYVSKFGKLQHNYIADSTAKTIKLSEIEMPNEKFTFQDNLRRFFLTTDDDMLIVRTDSDSIEYVDVNKLTTIDDIYRILKLGYQTPDLEGSKTNTVQMRCCHLFSTIHLKSNWLDRVMDNVVHNEGEGVYLKNPSKTHPYYLPKDNEISIFDMEDEFTKKYMQDKYCEFDVTGHFERAIIHKVLGNRSGYVLNRGTNVFDWSKERLDIWQNFFETHENGELNVRIDKGNGEYEYKSISKDEIKGFMKDTKDFSMKDLK